MELQSLTEPELIYPDLDCSDRTSLLRVLARRLAERGRVADAEELYQRLLEREQLGSTGVGAGVAIPHCKMSGLDQVVMAIGVVRQGIDFGAVDHQPVRLFFLVISPSHAPAIHLRSLAAISKWIKVEKNVETLLELDDPGAIYRQLGEG